MSPQAVRVQQRARRLARHQRALLAAFATKARPIMLECLRVDRSCLASTRIAVEVLGSFGLRGRAVVCSTRLLNPAIVRLGCQLQRLPTEAEALAVDGWIVHCGEPREAYDADEIEILPDDWFGHMVAVFTLADDAHVLVDASFDQFTRPAHDMHPPPILVADVPASFLARGEGRAIPLPDCGPMLATYEPRDTYEPYHLAPDWVNFTARYGALTVRLIRLLAQEVACPAPAPGA